MHSEKILSLVFLLYLSLTVFCQRASDKEQLKKLFKPTEKAKYDEYLKQSTNEIEGSAALIFIGYKSFFSSQDMASCVFTPSCSVYAIESLKHDPIFVAYLKIFDRLQRCHPLSAAKQYPIHKKTGKLYDPVY